VRKIERGDREPIGEEKVDLLGSGMLLGGGIQEQE